MFEDYSSEISTDDADHILVCNFVTQSDTLRDVPCTGTPYERVLERLLEGAVYLVTDVFDGGIASDNQRLAEVWICPFSAPI